MTSPLDAADLRARVQPLIDTALAEQGVILTSVGDDLSPMIESLQGLLAGGKRLRPAFCYWGWRSTGYDPALDDQAMKAAASLEFLQACALIHDDVMDGSDTRRGMPAAHRRFAHLHRGEGWSGSPENFGLGAAILLGDLCLSWADEMLLGSGMPPEATNRAKAVYDVMRTELMAGQYLDLLEQARGGGSVERALRVVRYKSAKYTIERPLHVGAALADASPDVIDALSGYGLPLGEAFQLRDDILGVFGDPAETGKPAGDDLREGKRTVLIAIAHERANAHQERTLRELVGDQGLDASGVTELRTIIADTGALEYTENLITELLDTSLAAVAHPGITAEGQEILTQLAYAATKRSV